MRTVRRLRTLWCLGLGLSIAALPACGPGGAATPAGPDLGAPDGGDGEGPGPLPSVASSWRFEHPLPQGNALYAATLTEGEAYAVGDHGAIVRLDGSGASQVAPGVTPAALRAVARVGGEIWAAGDLGSVVRGQGGRFQGLRAGAEPLFAIWSAGGAVHLAGRGPQAYRFDGRRFQGFALPGLRPGDTVRAAAVSGDDVFLAASGGRVLRGRGGGWFLEGDGLTGLDLLSATVASDGAVYAAGAGGAILRRDPQSGRWALEHPLGEAAVTRAELRAIFPAGDAVLALGADGAVLRRQGMGPAPWIRDGSTPTAVPLRGGAGDGGAALAVGDAGLLLRRGAALGSSWQAPPGAVQLGAAALSALAVDGAVVYAVADSGVILRRQGPSDWRIDYAPSPGPGQPLWSVAARGGEAYAVGAGGVILRRSGQGWQPEGYPWTGKRPEWRGVTILPGGDVLAVGAFSSPDADAEAAILRRSGGAWQGEAPSPRVPRGLYAVAAGGGTILAVGGSGTILRREPGGWVVEQGGAEGGAQLFAVAAAGGTFYAAGTQGVVLRREVAAGAPTWTAAPIAQAGAGAGTLTALCAVGEDLYAVGQGGLAARRSGGVWSVESTLTGALLSGVALTGGDVLAVGEGGAVLRRPAEGR